MPTSSNLALNIISRKIREIDLCNFLPIWFHVKKPKQLNSIWIQFHGKMHKIKFLITCFIGNFTEIFIKLLLPPRMLTKVDFLLFLKVTVWSTVSTLCSRFSGHQFIGFTRSSGHNSVYQIAIYIHSKWPPI